MCVCVVSRSMCLSHAFVFFSFFFLAGFVVKTGVTGILTNSLFGWGRIWNGKAFFLEDGTVGVNRFYEKDDTIEHHHHDPHHHHQHKFDISLLPSRLNGGGGGGGDSLRLTYASYQFPLSLWRTMEDELRVLPATDGQVLLGMGHMAWSGGILNCSPFCLHRTTNTAATEKL